MIIKFFIVFVSFSVAIASSLECQYELSGSGKYQLKDGYDKTIKVLSVSVEQKIEMYNRYNNSLDTCEVCQDFLRQQLEIKGIGATFEIEPRGSWKSFALETGGVVKLTSRNKNNFSVTAYAIDNSKSYAPTKYCPLVEVSLANFSFR